MPEPAIQILGIYKLDVSDELVEEAMQLKYGGMSLSGSQLRRAKEASIEELSSTVLIDVLVSNPDERFDVGDFGPILSKRRTMKYTSQRTGHQSYRVMNHRQVITFALPFSCISLIQPSR